MLWIYCEITKIQPVMTFTHRPDNILQNTEGIIKLMLLWRIPCHERGGMWIAPRSSVGSEHPKSDRALCMLAWLPPITTGLNKCRQTLPTAAAKLLWLFSWVCPRAQAISFVPLCFCEGIWWLQNMSHYWLEVVTIWWLFRWSGTNE